MWHRVCANCADDGEKTLTGSGKASKEEVAAVLERYVGRQEYATDDESDDVAVGITWLIRNSFIQTEEGREQN